MVYRSKRLFEATFPLLASGARVLESINFQAASAFHGLVKTRKMESSWGRAFSARGLRILAKPK
jgi:hypothetical protein